MPVFFLVVDSRSLNSEAAHFGCSVTSVMDLALTS